MYKRVAKRCGVYASQFERDTDIDLSSRHAGAVYNVRNKKGVYLPFTVDRKYWPDFIVAAKKGVWYIETKGRWTGAERTKLLSVINRNPGVDIRMVFMADNWISPKTKANRYSDWCRAHNIKFAIGKVPDAWLYE